MSTFYYGYSIEYSSAYLGVCCDICGNALYTRRTGQEFPEHVTIDARSAGWEHKKISPTAWEDYCPKCIDAMQEKRRKEILESMKVR